MRLWRVAPAKVYRITILGLAAEPCHGAMICKLELVLAERPVVDAVRVDAAEHFGPSARIVPGIAWASERSVPLWEGACGIGSSSNGGRAERPFLFAYTSLARLAIQSCPVVMTDQDRERERLARWLRNDPEYDDWCYATEPIPGDRSWAKKKAPEGAEDYEASSQSG